MRTGGRRQRLEQRSDESLRFLLEASNSGHHPRHVPEPVPNLDLPSRLDRELEGLGGLEPRDIRCTSLAGAASRGRWCIGPGVAGKRGDEGQHDCRCSAFSEQCLQSQIGLDAADVGRTHGDHSKKAIAPSAKECDAIAEQKQVLEPLFHVGNPESGPPGTE